MATAFLPLRGDSPTLALAADGKLPAILGDRAFWRVYVAGLARGRFNLLHLHGFAISGVTASMCASS